MSFGAFPGASFVPSSREVTLLDESSPYRALKTHLGIRHSFFPSPPPPPPRCPVLEKYYLDFSYITVKVKTGLIMPKIEEEFCNSPQRRSMSFLSLPLTEGIDGGPPRWRLWDMGIKTDYHSGRREKVLKAPSAPPFWAEGMTGEGQCRLAKPPCGKQSRSAAQVRKSCKLGVWPQS